MKATNCLIILITAALAVVIPLQAKETADTTLKAILLDANAYKNDRVTYEAMYGGFTTNAPMFLDRNGFKEGKDVVITAGSIQFLIIAERKDVDHILLDLKRGSIIKVSGKVKEMKKDPKRGIGTGHYLELESMEVVKAASKDHDQNHKKHPLKKKKGIKSGS